MKEFQRTVLWIVFGISLLLIWDNWQRANGQPGMFEAPKTAASAASSAAPKVANDPSVPKAAGNAATSAAVPGATPATTPAVAAAPARNIEVNTDVFKLTFNTQGATLTRAELVKHPQTIGMTDSGLIAMVMGKPKKTPTPTTLFEVSPERLYVAETGLVGGTDLPNHKSAFTFIEGPTQLKAGDQKLELKFASESEGVRLVKTYTVRPGRYDIEVNHSVTNIGSAAITPALYLQIARDGNPPPGESSFYSTFTGPAVYTDVSRFQKVTFKDITKKKVNRHETKAADGWIGMVQHYFVTAWIPSAGEREISTQEVSANKFTVNTVQTLPAIAPGATHSNNSVLYAGPQDQAALAKLTPGLDLVVDYGILTMLAKPLFWLMQFFHNNVVANWGWAIVLLTITVKAILFYPSALGFRSMARLKKVTPRMMEIREKYGDDRMKMNQAMMELYKTEKVNPVGGCLPILMQMPLFLALYWMLLASVETRNSPWIGWITDLATPDPWFVLPVILTGTMILQMKMNPPAPDPMQQKIMSTMPFVFGIMFFFFPSGLNLYYCVNNVLSMAQQWWITRQLEKQGLK